MKRRKPDIKLQIVEQNKEVDDLTEELKYATNQRLLTPGNPFRYQILRSDFRACSTYQVHLLNAKDRVTVKTYIPKIRSRNMQDTGVKTSGYEGIIRDL